MTDNQLQLYGISESNRGRSCSNHLCCGNILVSGSVVRLKKCRVICELDVEELAVEAVVVMKGKDCCRVGFIPRDNLNQADFYHGKIMQVGTFLRDSTQPKDIRKNDACRGVCWGHIIDAAVVYPDGIMEVGTALESEDVDEVRSYDSSKDEEIDSPPTKRNKIKGRK